MYAESNAFDSYSFSQLGNIALISLLMDKADGLTN